MAISAESREHTFASRAASSWRREHLISDTHFPVSQDEGGKERCAQKNGQASTRGMGRSLVSGDDYVDLIYGLASDNDSLCRETRDEEMGRGRGCGCREGERQDLLSVCSLINRQSLLS